MLAGKLEEGRDNFGQKRRKRNKKKNRKRTEEEEELRGRQEGFLHFLLPAVSPSIWKETPACYVLCVTNLPHWRIVCQH